MPYSASGLDGANARQRFKSITVPSIRAIVVLILSISGALSVFEMPYVVTNGTFGTSACFVVMNKLARTDVKAGLRGFGAYCLPRHYGL